MPSCANCGDETMADQGTMTAEGLLCQGCSNDRDLRAAERRAEISLNHAKRNDPAAMLGDATFDPRRRKLAVLAFVIGLGLLLVLYALRLGQVL